MRYRSNNISPDEQMNEWMDGRTAPTTYCLHSHWRRGGGEGTKI